MTPTRQLRLRFLAVLSGGLLLATVPVGCSGETSKEELKPSCSSGTPMTQCFAPGSTHFNVGNTPTTQPEPTPHFDGNNCQVRDEVRDGCCTAANTGPELINGECCYGFCTGACCGRPLLVDGQQRVAPVALRCDWLEALAVDVTGLTPDARAELSRQWLRDAQLEHASIASFARFALDLLAFGAPAELLERAQRALCDELAHARACFALASAYAGEPFGPGPLSLEGIAPSHNLAAAAAAAVREGCINETIAALAAEQQLEHAQDPCVRQVLERIARDEAEHAELAWRFVHWAMQGGEPGVVSAVQTVLQGVQPVGSEALQRGQLRRHGRLTDAELSGVASVAWREVIAPCAAALS